LADTVIAIDVLTSCRFVKWSCNTRRGFVEILLRYRNKICSCLRWAGGTRRQICCSVVTNSCS